MPLGKADTRPNDRDYYQAMPEGSDHGDGPIDHPSNVCGISDVQSGANSLVGQQQQRRHSDTDNNSDTSINNRHLRRSTLYSVTGYIIVTEFCERLAYYGFAGSLVLLFETEVRMTNADADTQFALWSGVCYVMPLAGGWVADSYLGRYNAILLFSALYLIGLVVAAASCVPGNVSPWLLFPAIYLLAVGTGGIKASVSVFGADQFDDDDPKDAEEKQSFFNWFYWSINLGALVSYTLVSYVCQYGLPFLGGPDWGFMAGYSIPCVAMAMAIIVFVAGTHKYRILPPTGSVVGLAAGVVVEAAFTKREGVRGQNSGVIESGSASDRMASPEGEEEERPHWLHRASEREGGSYPHDEVASVSRVWKLLPFLVLQVPYWAVYAQMGTAFQNQGCQMNLAVFGFDIPVATLNMFDTLAILLLIPVVDQGVYPWMRRMGCEPTMLRKIGTGLLFAGAAVLAAAAVEVARRRGVLEGDEAIMSPCRRERDYDPTKFQDFWRTQGTAHVAERPAYCHQVEGCEDIGPDGLLSLDCIECEAPPLSSELSVLWQVPQFLLIGTSEILSSVTSLEFFYAEAPSTMRGVSAGLNLLTTALGSWITVPLLGLVNSGAFGEAWVPDDLNGGHLELYFFLLAGLVAVSLSIFVVVARSYCYQGVTDVSPTLTVPTERESVESGVGGNPLVRSNSCSSGDGGRSQRGEREGPGRSWEEGRKLLPGVGEGKRSVSPTFGQI